MVECGERERKLSSEVDDCTPVSYTHLDVYKRQASITDDLEAEIFQRLQPNFPGVSPCKYAVFPLAVYTFQYVAVLPFHHALRLVIIIAAPVSYTHLDVYKRQFLYRSAEAKQLRLC